MSSKDDGGPAFPEAYMPTPHSDCPDYRPGMSLLDWYAGQIAGQMISGATFWSTERPREVARDAYDVAAAMLAERKRRAAK